MSLREFQRGLDGRKTEAAVNNSRAVESSKFERCLDV